MPCRTYAPNVEESAQTGDAAGRGGGASARADPGWRRRRRNGLPARRDFPVAEPGVRGRADEVVRPPIRRILERFRERHEAVAPADDRVRDCAESVRVEEVRVQEETCAISRPMVRRDTTSKNETP